MKKYTILLCLLILVGCSKQIPPQIDFPNHLPENKNKILYGVASYYDYTIGDWSSVGHYVCATRDFIRYSMVRATNVANNKSVECKVTDYGPDEEVHPDRIIDLSSTAFSAIASLSRGTINIKVEQLNEN